jgi:hypothetical protein
VVEVTELDHMLTGEIESMRHIHMSLLDRLRAFANHKAFLVMNVQITDPMAMSIKIMDEFRNMDVRRLATMI